MKGYFLFITLLLQLFRKMPEAGNLVVFRGTFTADAALISSIDCMEYATVHSALNSQMPTAQLPGFKHICHWGERPLHVLLMPSIGSLTCLPSSMVPVPWQFSYTVYNTTNSTFTNLDRIPRGRREKRWREN